ncbi:hypothetical protein ACHAWT_002403 [Skeletonema menzelii]
MMSPTTLNTETEASALRHSMHARIEIHDPGLETMNVKTVVPPSGSDQDLTNSANCRPSRRATFQGRPLKKSSHRSSLRSSHASIASNTSPSMRRNVSFSSLEIRSYGITLGDTPMLKGPPISLDWSNHTSTEVHDIENYEKIRSVTAENPTPLNPRRTKNELFIRPLPIVKTSTCSMQAFQGRRLGLPRRKQNAPLSSGIRVRNDRLGLMK